MGVGWWEAGCAPPPKLGDIHTRCVEALRLTWTGVVRQVGLGCGGRNPGFPSLNLGVGARNLGVGGWNPGFTSLNLGVGGKGDWMWVPGTWVWVAGTRVSPAYTRVWWPGRLGGGQPCAWEVCTMDASGWVGM